MQGMIAIVFATILLLAPGSSYAQELIDGEVKKVDGSAGKITIKHGPWKKFDMDEGHTMVFRAQDAAFLGAVKAGDKVKFDAEKINGQFTVTKIEKAGKK
jgi:Cu(I)/Ag(I) efflux system protein CusF